MANMGHIGMPVFNNPSIDVTTLDFDPITHEPIQRLPAPALLPPPPEDLNGDGVTTPWNSALNRFDPNTQTLYYPALGEHFTVTDGNLFRMQTQSPGSPGGISRLDLIQNQFILNWQEMAQFRGAWLAQRTINALPQHVQGVPHVQDQLRLSHTNQQRLLHIAFQRLTGFQQANANNGMQGQDLANYATRFNQPIDPATGQPNPNYISPETLMQYWQTYQGIRPLLQANGWQMAPNMAPQLQGNDRQTFIDLLPVMSQFQSYMNQSVMVQRHNDIPMSGPSLTQAELNQYADFTIEMSQIRGVSPIPHLSQDFTVTNANLVNAAGITRLNNLTGPAQNLSNLNIMQVQASLNTAVEGIQDNINSELLDVQTNWNAFMAHVDQLGLVIRRVQRPNPQPGQSAYYFQLDTRNGQPLSITQQQQVASLRNTLFWLSNQSFLFDRRLNNARGMLSNNRAAYGAQLQQAATALRATGNPDDLHLAVQLDALYARFCFQLNSIGRNPRLNDSQGNYRTTATGPDNSDHTFTLADIDSLELGQNVSHESFGISSTGNPYYRRNHLHLGTSITLTNTPLPQLQAYQRGMLLMFNVGLLPSRPSENADMNLDTLTTQQRYQLLSALSNPNQRELILAYIQHYETQAQAEINSWLTPNPNALNHPVMRTHFRESGMASFERRAELQALLTSNPALNTFLTRAMDTSHQWLPAVLNNTTDRHTLLRLIAFSNDSSSNTSTADLERLLTLEHALANASTNPYAAQQALNAEQAVLETEFNHLFEPFGENGRNQLTTISNRWQALSQNLARYGYHIVLNEEGNGYRITFNQSATGRNAFTSAVHGSGMGLPNRAHFQRDLDQLQGLIDDLPETIDWGSLMGQVQAFENHRMVVMTMVHESRPATLPGSVNLTAFTNQVTAMEFPNFGGNSISMAPRLSIPAPSNTDQVFGLLPDFHGENPPTFDFDSVPESISTGSGGTNTATIIRNWSVPSALTNFNDNAIRGYYTQQYLSRLIGNHQYSHQMLSQYIMLLSDETKRSQLVTHINNNTLTPAIVAELAGVPESSPVVQSVLQNRDMLKTVFGSQGNPAEQLLVIGILASAESFTYANRNILPGGATGNFLVNVVVPPSPSTNPNLPERVTTVNQPESPSPGSPLLVSQTPVNPTTPVPPPTQVYQSPSYQQNQIHFVSGQSQYSPYIPYNTSSTIYDSFSYASTYQGTSYSAPYMSLSLNTNSISTSGYYSGAFNMNPYVGSYLTDGYYSSSGLYDSSRYFSYTTGSYAQNNQFNPANSISPISLEDDINPLAGYIHSPIPQVMTADLSNLV